MGCHNHSNDEKVVLGYLGLCDVFAAIMDTLLYDSTFCRLCAEENSNGVLLYSAEDEEVDLSAVVNRYLPFKVQDDGKLPRSICPGCHIQLQATAQFFDLLVEGQKKIREMWKNQLEMQRKERHREAHGGESLLISSDHNQQELITDDDQIVTIQIMADGSLFPADHEIALKIEGLERPRRKRGRPPKRPVEAVPENAENDAANVMEQTVVQETLPEPVEEEVEDVDGRKRRKRKVPQRFMEAVAGKELERIFREEGVIDEDEPEDEEEDDEDEVKLSIGVQEVEEVIGHLETQEGQDLGELVVSRGRGRGRPRGGKRRRIKFECEICGRGFQHRGRYLLHKSCHKGVKFECTECNKRFSTRENFEVHQKLANHEGEGIIEGVEGGENGEQLKSDLRYNCDQCDKTFQTKQSHEVHFKAIHQGHKPFSCEVCGKHFAYHNSLKFHMASHEVTKNDKGYPCDICGKHLNHPSSVVYHKEAEHNNGRRFVCNKCGKGFKHKQLLQRHQLVHSEDRPYNCKSCGASFKTKANLLNHQPTHTGEKKYFCEKCGQQFAHKTSLTLHYRWHDGQKPYECSVCQKTFSQNGNLQEHLRIHTGEKPFCCDFCGRKFTTSSQFKLHVKRHTGERPWKCEFCGKSFLHKDTWKCHTRRHKGERPFACKYCNRGFTEQWALKKHIRLHTGEKPYMCNICHKTFADCSNLTKHKRVHRENKDNTVGNGMSVVDPGVWSLIRSHLAKEAAESGEGGMEGSEMLGEGDDVMRHQVIYVTYQDPDDPSQAQTLQLVEDMGTEVDIQPPDMEMELESDEVNVVMKMEGEQVDDIDNPASLRVTDQEGNPIHFTMQDGRELQVSITTADGQSLHVTTVDGRTIPLQLMTPDGQQVTSEMASQLQPMLDAASGKINCIDDTELPALEESVEELQEGEQSIEYTTEDGRKVRLVTSYDVDTLQLASDYLNQ